MEIRFVLDEQFDADLIARIQGKSNGSGHNLAARFLMRHWYESEITGFSPPERQGGDAGTAKPGNDLEANLSSLEDAWLE